MHYIHFQFIFVNYLINSNYYYLINSKSPFVMRHSEIRDFAVCELNNPCCLTQRISVQVRTSWLVYCFQPCPALLHFPNTAVKPDIGDSVSETTYLAESDNRDSLNLPGIAS